MSEDIPSLRLSAKQERAASFIARGRNKAETAREATVQVSKATMQRWSNDPSFKRRVEELRTSVDRQATEILQQALTEAARTLVDIAVGRLSAVTVRCATCGGEASTGVDMKELALRQKTAQWILDMHYRGKILEPKLSGAGKSDPMDDDFDESTRDELLARGGGDDEDEDEEDEE